MLPPAPANVDPLALPPAERAVLMRFATDVDGAPFIPALYRQLARFPGFLAWLADALVPRLTAPETNAARAAFRAAAMDAAPAIVARLPGLPPPPRSGCRDDTADPGDDRPLCRDQSGDDDVRTAHSGCDLITTAPEAAAASISPRHSPARHARFPPRAD